MQSHIVGNQEAQNTLKTYIETVLSEKTNKPAFFLLSGPKGIGKSTVARQFVQELLGMYVQSDFLYIRDCSHVLGKIHNLKIELPSDKSKQTIEIQDGNGEPSLYQDVGTRELNAWMQRAPVGKAKVVLIENIERMTTSAANAFLKTCEEPLPNRIIIATTAHQSQLLDTIISRAIITRFQQLSHQEILDFCKQKNLFQDNEALKTLVVDMVMGKPGLLYGFDRMFAENKELEGRLVKLFTLLKQREYSLFEVHKMLVELHKAGTLISFLDGWIAYCVLSERFPESEKWLKVKKMLNTNVNIENILLYGLL